MTTRATHAQHPLDPPLSPVFNARFLAPLESARARELREFTRDRKASLTHSLTSLPHSPCGAFGQLRAGRRWGVAAQRAFFFTRDKLVELFENAGFEALEIKVRDCC